MIIALYRNPDGQKYASLESEQAAADFMAHCKHAHISCVILEGSDFGKPQWREISRYGVIIPHAAPARNKPRERSEFYQY